MRRIAITFFLALLMGAITYTIHAQTSVEENRIQIPEGTITEIVEIMKEHPTANNTQEDLNAETIVEIDTVEVPEGTITERTEVVDPYPQTDNFQSNDPSVNLHERLQYHQDTLSRLQQEQQKQEAAE